MSKTRSIYILGLLALLFFGVGGPAAYADTVTLNTSGLVGNAAGPFSLAFIFTDGSGVGDANNTILLSSFGFGGGSAGSVNAFLSAGGKSGTLSTTASLVDSSFFNAFVSGFTPGSTLTFTLAMTTKVDAGSTPDQFSFSILNTSGSSIHTQDPTGANSLLTVNINSATPTIQTFASDFTPAPTVSAVPEPATLLLLGTGLGGLALRRKMRQRQ